MPRMPYRFILPSTSPRRAQLDAAVLGYGRPPAVRQLARPTAPARRESHRGPRSENLRVIGLEGKLGLMPLLVPEPVESLNGGHGVGTALPLAGCTPGELCGLGRALLRFPLGQQGVYVDAVVDTLLSHFGVSSTMWKVLCTALAARNQRTLRLARRGYNGRPRHLIR
jgi:hypothetical protein